MWFPHLAVERALRLRTVDGPLALTLRQSNTDRLYDVNEAAAALGLASGMTVAEARSFCPDLRLWPADPAADRRFLAGLRRWATRYCPWVGFEAPDGLVLDISGSAHLFGGEEALLGDLRARLRRSGLTVRLGLGSSRGAAWALAHYAEGSVPPGQAAARLGPLPVAALRLEADTVTALQRLGLHRISDLMSAARAPLARRFGPGLLTRLDQAFGLCPEPVTPLADPPVFAVRLTLPEPVGLQADVEAGLQRLLGPLCARLEAKQMGARALCLTLRRVDGKSQDLPIRLAAAMRDPARILPLFSRLLEKVDAGFGIDQLRLEASQVEALRPQQTGTGSQADPGAETLLTRIGTRIGLDNILRFQARDSHLPEYSCRLVPVAGSEPEPDWQPRRRPLRLFPPEPVSGSGPVPPARFRWRRMGLTTGRASGPERIAPEWWAEHDGWRSGLRDYWRVETCQGRRLWMFFTPQSPGWFVHGEFL